MTVADLIRDKARTYELNAESFYERGLKDRGAAAMTVALTLYELAEVFELEREAA